MRQLRSRKQFVKPSVRYRDKIKKATICSAIKGPLKTNKLPVNFINYNQASFKFYTFDSQRFFYVYK